MATTSKAAKPAVAKKTTKAPVKAPAAKAPAAKASASKVAPAAAKSAPAVKPVKDTFTKATLATYLAEQSGVDPKSVKSVLAALEATVLGSVSKKGSGEFTLSGLIKIGVQKVPAKKKRFGKDPFTGEERWFDAKPASVRIKTRALKKLKDAAQ